MRAAVLARDLFAATRAGTVLEALGVPAEVVEPAPDALRRLQDEPPDLLVLDLAVPGDVRAAVLGWAPGRLPVVAFGSHVDGDALAAARRAGCAAVTTNARLDRDLQAFLHSRGG
jgi:CheY-like chemotaxis protein